MHQPSYTPISCDFHDVLELAIVRGSVNNIVYNVNNNELSVNSVATDIIIIEKAEYLVLASGQRIRLDYIVSFNGEPLSRVC